MLLLLGVCNTDNFSLLSITIDYGPFGFMDDYDPGNRVILYITFKTFRTFYFGHFSSNFGQISYTVMNIAKVNLRTQNANYTETTCVDLIVLHRRQKKTRILMCRKQCLLKSSLHKVKLFEKSHSQL